MKRMLVISYFFPPAGGVAVLRTVKLVKYLPKYGIEPTVLTPQFPITPIVDEKLLREVNCEIVRTPQFYQPAIKGTRHRSVDTDVELKDSFFRRALHKILWSLFKQIIYPDIQFFWIYHAYKEGVRTIRDGDVDILYATTPPITNIIVQLLLRLKTGLPLVVDFRDDWVGYPLRSQARYSIWINPLYYLLDRVLERYILKEASLVISVSNPLLNSIKNRYKGISGDKFICIPNGYDNDQFEGVKPAKRDDGFLMVYTGTFDTFRNVEPFLRGLKLSLERDDRLKKDFELRIIGGVWEKNKEMIEELGLSDYVNLSGRASHKVCIRNILSADCLLLINPPASRKGAEFLPLKFSEYLRANKDILAVTPEGPVYDIIKKHNLGYAVDHSDIEGIANAIISIYKNRKTGRDVNREIVREFDMERLIERISVEIRERIH